MTIEEKIFSKKKFVKDRVLAYGFEADRGSFVFETDFFDGDFRPVLTISKDGKLSGKVIDLINDDEYLAIRRQNLDSYAQTVKNAYEELLKDVAENCCETFLFAAPQANRICKLIKENFDILPDFPFRKKNTDAYGVFRHEDNNKWFAIMMGITIGQLLKNEDSSPIEVINLKINPNDGQALRDQKTIFPAYHMNQKHWISVVLDDMLSDQEILELIKESYNLTKSKWGKDGILGPLRQT